MWARLTYLLFLFSAVQFGLVGLSGRVFAGEYQVIDVKDGGTIKGVATWNGDVPHLQEIQLIADTETCGEVVLSPALEVDLKSKGVRSVLVYLDRVEKGKAPADKYWLHMGKDRTNTVPNTEACQFKERIFTFVRTQPTAMINFDRLLHNPHFLNDRNISVLNLYMSMRGSEVDTNFLQYHGKGVMKFQCDIHTHMNGYWVGFQHPYFAVTDAAGKFEITGVPPGEYTLVAWHEGYKSVREDVARPSYDRPHVLRKEIQVKPRESVEVEFEFPVRKVTME